VLHLTITLRLFKFSPRILGVQVTWASGMMPGCFLNAEIFVGELIRVDLARRLK
jgi:hypothetical protein